TIIKDLYLGARPQQQQNEKMIKRFSSLTTLVLGLLVLLAAWRPPEMIIWLNLLAFGGLEAVFLWPLVLGLYWQRANAQGALSSMAAGAVCYTLLASFNLQLAGLHPIVPALLVSLLAFYIGNLVGEKRRPASSLSS
ncbi:sodium:solute symporter family transporter, partial [Escherichia coli]